jgi:putative transposase
VDFSIIFDLREVYSYGKNMPYRKINFGSNHYYHVFNRGVNKQAIFFEEDHFSICLRLIHKYLSVYSVKLFTWCLMPNHYHFILWTELENGISRFVQVVFNAYVQSLNKRIERKGPLFEGRFKHVLIDEQTYLMQLCRYIHLNPVKAGLVQKPGEWAFSDYLEWTGKRRLGLTKANMIKDCFGGFREYETFVCDLMNDRSLQVPGKYLLE